MRLAFWAIWATCWLLLGASVSSCAPNSTASCVGLHPVYLSSDTIHALTDEEVTALLTLDRQVKGCAG